MTIDFGLALPPGPPKDDTSKWLTDIEATVRLLQDDCRSLWAFDHL